MVPWYVAIFLGVVFCVFWLPLRRHVAWAHERIPAASPPFVWYQSSSIMTTLTRWPTAQRSASRQARCTLLSKMLEDRAIARAAQRDSYACQHHPRDLVRTTVYLHNLLRDTCQYTQHSSVTFANDLDRAMRHGGTRRVTPIIRGWRATGNERTPRDELVWASLRWHTTDQSHPEHHKHFEWMSRLHVSRYVALVNTA